MRFSARQQHCLQAMGIVPWVSTHPVELETVAEVATITMPTAEHAAGPPETVARLGAWIASRALAPIHWRGSQYPVLGAAESPVLVIVEQVGTKPAAAALEGDSARLFALMLRSIQLGARDTRQCIVSAEPVAGAELNVATVACTPQTMAVLVLMDTWPFDITDTDVQSHQGCLQGHLAGQQLPMWRMAHPRHLLERPLLKRQSWQVLKALRSVLTGSGLA